MLPTPLMFARVAFAINILILVPVVIACLRDSGRTLSVFEHKVENNDALRLLVASLWLSILVLSFWGLMEPAKLLPLLVLQVIYKAAYLLLYIVPLAMRRGVRAIPLGITTSFALIVAAWLPILLMNVR
jgi:hypothetical protein